MGYDIPDEIKYREKIIFNLDWKQLGYAALFGIAAIVSYGTLQLQGQMRFIIPAIFAFSGAGFILLNLEEKVFDLISYFTGIRKAPHNSQAARNFFEVESIEDNIIYLKNGKIVAILEVQPINFELLDESRKRVLITNYKAFLNQLTIPVQILIRTRPVKLTAYFKAMDSKKRSTLLSELYNDFKGFEMAFLASQKILERSHYLALPMSIQNGKIDNALKLLEGLIKITQEKLSACGIDSVRLTNSKLVNLLSSYAEEIDTAQKEEVKPKPMNPFLKTLNDRFFSIQKQIDEFCKKDKKITTILGKFRKKYRYAQVKLRNIKQKSRNYLKDAQIRLESLKSKVYDFISIKTKGWKIFQLKKVEQTLDQKSEELADLITPSFDINKNYAIVEGEFHSIIKVAGYPRKVEDGWLGAFLCKNEAYDISIHITPSTISGMLVYLHNQIIQQNSDLFSSTSKGTPNPALEIKKADTMRVYDSIYKGEEKMFYVSAYVDNKATTQDNLDLLSEKCKSNLNSNLMVPKTTSWRMADGIKSMLPLAKDKLAIRKEFLTNSMAATFPFISASSTKKNGILFAHEANTLNPLFIDFDSMNNKHFFVIGISGAGKSYTAKYLIMGQLFKEETAIYILDPNGEYSALCKNLGGQVIELSRESESNISIFDLAGDDYGNKMMNLLSAFDIIVGGVTESQKGVLSKVLSRAYEKRGIMKDNPKTWNKPAPTFSDIRTAIMEIKSEYTTKKDYIQDSSTDALLNRVEMYCWEGLFGFLDKQSKLEINKGFVCFDLSKLPQAVKTLMMFATLETIRSQIIKDKKPKVVLIDEGWSLLRSKEAANYILEFIKTSRKFNASLGFISQEIEDLLSSKTGKSILNTACVKILMRQNPSNIDLIGNTLKLNEQAMNYLLTAPNGFGLLVTENNAYKFYVRASEKLHKLITTNPTEVNSIKTDEPEKEFDIDLARGIYRKSELTEDEIEYLKKNRYVQCKSRIEQFGGSAIYLVKRRGTESPDHSYLCWSTYHLAKKRFKNVEINPNSPGDVIVRAKNKTVGFEIETAENFRKFDEDEMKKKFGNLQKICDDYYIIVNDADDEERYIKYGKVIKRNQIKAVLDGIGHTNNSDR